MSTPWVPQVPVSRALVERLLREQCPALDLAQLSFVAAGWDHAVWRCGDTVLRFPHQHESLHLAADHAASLRALAELLPVAIPSPVHVGEPSAGYPGRFVAYRWIPGEISAHLSLTLEERAATAEPMAEVLRALHAVPAETARRWGAELRPCTGELALRTRYAADRVEQLADTPHARLAARAAEAMAVVPAEAEAHCLVHGDLHAGQILMDADHQLSGIVDWDELCVGDPAYDLMFVHAFVPPAARHRFWAVYGDFDGRPRARHLALSYGLAILAQAVVGGQAALAAEAAFSLENALTPSSDERGY